MSINNQTDAALEVENVQNETVAEDAYPTASERPQPETNRGCLKSWLVRFVVGVIVLLMAVGVIGRVVYGQARADWDKPLEVKPYPSMNLILQEEGDSRDFRRYVQRTTAADLNRLWSEAEEFFDQQLDRCNKQYGTTEKGELNQHLYTDCFEERTHNFLGFVQYAHVRIYPGTVYASYECQGSTTSECLNPALIVDITRNWGE